MTDPDFLSQEKAIGKRQKRIIATVALVFVSFIVWAASFELEEVAVGDGKIIPSSQVQSVQSVQGGRVIELYAEEGDFVEEGQLVALLDTTKLRAELEEIEAGYLDGRAQQQLVEALLADAQELTLEGDFPADLVRQKTALFFEMKTTQERAVADLENELALLEQEREIFERASQLGGGTEIERLRLDQKIAGVNTTLNSTVTSYKNDLRKQLDEVNRSVQQLNIRQIATRDLLIGNELRSPRNGIVQQVLVSTAGGGVLPPNGTVMDIVPVEDRLLIEARFSPRDIAFIAPNQKARVKVTAYDAAIYGDLEATVLRVSPDSFQDETRNGEYYFAVTLESEQNYFDAGNGRQLPIIPGMVTTTEILTGQRTVLQYLLKPLNRASDALRER